MRQERALEELGRELAGVHGDTGARHAHGRALPGHSKARGGAHKVRGGKAVLMREKGRIEVERVACAGTSSDELGHGGAEKKVGHHSLSPRLRQPHAGANEGA